MPGLGIDYVHPRRRHGATPASTQPSAVTGSCGYSLFANPDGSTVRFDPRETIWVRVNLDQAGRGALEDIAEALDRVSEASGLTFDYAGLTDRIPQGEDYSDDPSTPSLTIAWAKPGRVPGGSDLLDPDEMAAAVPAAMPYGATPFTVGIGGWRVRRVRFGTEPWRFAITTAQVVIDSTVRELFAPGFREGPCRGAVLLHEIGHAVGLGHVDDPDQIMYPVVTDKPARFGAGDLAGLARLGTSAGPLA